jgi:hypothetical protein
LAAAQKDELRSVAIVPLGQGVHLDAPVVAYEPGAHREHCQSATSL